MTEQIRFGAVRPQPCRPCLSVDLAAIRANTVAVRQITRTRLIAVVKADGYGLGAAHVARAALEAGAWMLGVATLEEAHRLRHAGRTEPVLAWLHEPGADFASAISTGVDVAVPSVEVLEATLRGALVARRPARLHLHADLGMARDGASAAHWQELCERARVAESLGLGRVVGLMGHLGWARDPDHPMNTESIRRFRRCEAVARREGLRPRTLHVAATAAGLAQPDARLDACRVGAGLIGIDPSGTHRLRAVASLSAPVVHVREVAAGTPVGYDGQYVASRGGRLALVGIGYADGIPRAAMRHAEVLVRGRRRPIVGEISMDQIVVDTGDDAVVPGERAVFFGAGDAGEPTIDDWAVWSNTIPHEIITGIGRRVERRVVHDAVRDDEGGVQRSLVADAPAAPRRQPAHRYDAEAS